MAAREIVLQVAGIRKRFGDVVAVDGVSFDVRGGEMFGLIGPDGAGKTTVLRVICGLLAPDEGHVRLLGVDPSQQRSVATSSIGYISQRFSLYGDLSIDENIEFFARIHGVVDFAPRRNRLLALTGLEAFRTRRADRLSGGMKQKLALACTLVHQPPILILDEPTTGVDPVSRREFWKLLAEFLADGLTIVMATPYLDEAERCSRVAMLGAGRLLALDVPARLQAETGGVLIELVVTPPRRALEIARQYLPPGDVQLFGDRLHAKVRAEGDGGPLRDALAAAGIEVVSWRRIVPTLEDVFIERLAEAAPDGRRAGGGETRP